MTVLDGWFKLFLHIADGQTDWQTDIGTPKVTIATENVTHIIQSVQLITVDYTLHKQLEKERGNFF